MVEIEGSETRDMFVGPFLSDLDFDSILHIFVVPLNGDLFRWRVKV